MDETEDNLEKFEIIFLKFRIGEKDETLGVTCTFVCTLDGDRDIAVTSGVDPQPPTNPNVSLL